jgi:hypothetical protein
MASSVFPGAPNINAKPGPKTQNSNRVAPITNARKWFCCNETGRSNREKDPAFGPGVGGDLLIVQTHYKCGELVARFKLVGELMCLGFGGHAADAHAIIQAIRRVVRDDAHGGIALG